METIKEVKFFVTVGGRLSRYMEIFEEILINIDEEDNENSLDKDANEDDEEADGNSTIDMTVDEDEEAQTPNTRDRINLGRGCRFIMAINQHESKLGHFRVNLNYKNS